MKDAVSKQVEKRKTKQASGVQAEFSRVVAVGVPWWAEAPRIFQVALNVMLLPFKVLVAILDVAVSIVFLVIVGSIVLWWIGYIPDEIVVGFAGDLGNRLLGIIEKAGFI